MANHPAPIEVNPDDLLAAEATETTDTDAISQDIAARILAADTVDAVFEQAGLTPARDVLDRPLVLRDLRFNRSGMAGGPPVYAVLDMADGVTGESVLVSCGARNVMAQAYKLRQLGALPLEVKITETERETASGYRPMWLAKVGG